RFLAMTDIDSVTRLSTISYRVSRRYYEQLLTVKLLRSMLNAAIISLFHELATYMQIAGENQFKIRAYKNAADAVQNLKVPIDFLAFNRQLENIDGLGESSINKINEFLTTGKMQDLEK